MKEYTKLSYKERCLIKIGIDSGKNPHQIGKGLDRHRSVITREISGNEGIYKYDPDKAHFKGTKPNRKNYCKIDRDSELKEYIIDKIKKQWSPVVISGRWNKENNRIKISTESIYSWIYSNSMKKEKLWIFLPRNKKFRGIKIRKFINQELNKPRICNRPEIVNHRRETGHWEADLVFQKGDQSGNFLTAIERKTRLAVVFKHESKHAEIISKSIKSLKNTYNIMTLTLDNGSEFSKYTEYDIDTYFCNPGSPWQKGAIEHLNG